MPPHLPGGAPSHASGTTFVPADLAASGRVSAYRRLGPVSIVDSEGNEIRLPQDHLREVLVAVVAIGVFLWLVSRRTQPVA
jgi:L-lactate utilization protein LutB